VLHITNGDHAVAVLQTAGIAGEILPWRDVLHEGPVRVRLTLDELSRERAAFIASAGWAPLPDVERGFRERDAKLWEAAGEDEVVLWFEHDLYDQLQLIQLLDWFAAHPGPALSLVCEAEYLGRMAAARAVELFRRRRPVTARQLEVGEAAWLAFRSPHPAPIEEVLAQDLASLPFLAAALRRHLEEFPWTSDGLSRLERAILDALRPAPLPFGRVFVATQEDPVFLGDAVLLWHLERMAKEGLVRKASDQWAFHSVTRSIRVPRWLGGVLVDETSRWRWDGAKSRLLELV